MTATSPGASAATGWQLVAVDDSLGDPDAAPASNNIITAGTNLPPPPAAAESSIAADVVMVAGLILAVVLAILVRNSVLKAQVAKMKPYDAAKNSALIAGVTTLFAMIAIAVFVGQNVMKG